jgi:hypothetical protein
VALNWPFPYPVLPPARGAATRGRLTSCRCKLAAPFFFLYPQRIGCVQGRHAEASELERELGADDDEARRRPPAATTQSPYQPAGYNAKVDVEEEDYGSDAEICDVE